MNRLMDHRQKNNFIVVAVFLSVIYNALLAFVNAYIMRIGFAHVAALEIFILLLCLMYIFQKGLREEDGSAFLFLLFIFLISIYISAINGIAYIDFFRNILIIFCFSVLGTWSSRKTVMVAFAIAIAVVMLFLFCEIFSLSLYAAIFKPALYFETTRGLKQASYDDSGLFANALGFKGRLSFGIINHRASSIFLEQVSLSNFAGVVMMFTLYFWPQLKASARILLVASITLILLTTASRTMLTFAAVCVTGYFVFPFIPKIFNILVMPLVLLGGALISFLKPEATGDNFTGRVVLTMRHVYDMDFWGYLGLSATKAAGFADSGYVYIVYGGTVFGLLAFWLFITFYPAGGTAPQRRLAHALSVFIFLNLMIGATPIFTSKIAGLLWLLVGHAKFPNMERHAMLAPVQAAAA